MKKILLVFVALALASPAWAAQQDLAEITVKASRQDLRTAINAENAKTQSNFDELYAADMLKADVSCFESSTTFNACFDLVWGDGGGGGGFDPLLYSAKATPVAADRLVGVDSSNDSTKTFSMEAMAGYFLTDKAFNMKGDETNLLWNDGVTYRDHIDTPSTLTLTTDTSISAAQLLANKYISNYGASSEVDLVLPAVSYNLSRTIIVEAEQVIEICPPSGEIFKLSGTALDADDCIDSPATVEAKAVFTRTRTGASTYQWVVDVVSGTWVDTGATD